MSTPLQRPKSVAHSTAIAVRINQKHSETNSSTRTRRSSSTSNMKNESAILSTPSNAMVVVGKINLASLKQLSTLTSPPPQATSSSSLITPRTSSSSRGVVYSARGGNIMQNRLETCGGVLKENVADAKSEQQQQQQQQQKSDSTIQKSRTSSPSSGFATSPAHVNNHHHQQYSQVRRSASSSSSSMPTPRPNSFQNKQNNNVIRNADGEEMKTTITGRSPSTSSNVMRRPVQSSRSVMGIMMTPRTARGNNNNVIVTKSDNVNNNEYFSSARPHSHFDPYVRSKALINSELEEGTRTINTALIGRTRPLLHNHRNNNNNKNQTRNEEAPPTVSTGFQRSSSSSSVDTTKRNLQNQQQLQEATPASNKSENVTQPIVVTEIEATKPYRRRPSLSGQPQHLRSSSAGGGGGGRSSSVQSRAPSTATTPLPSSLSSKTSALTETMTMMMLKLERISLGAADSSSMVPKQISTPPLSSLLGAITTQIRVVDFEHGGKTVSADRSENDVGDDDVGVSSSSPLLLYLRTMGLTRREIQVIKPLCVVTYQNQQQQQKEDSDSSQAASTGLEIRVVSRFSPDHVPLTHFAFNEISRLEYVLPSSTNTNKKSNVSQEHNTSNSNVNVVTTNHGSRHLPHRLIVGDSAGRVITLETTTHNSKRNQLAFLFKLLKLRCRASLPSHSAAGCGADDKDSDDEEDKHDDVEETQTHVVDHQLQENLQVVSTIAEATTTTTLQVATENTLTNNNKKRKAFNSKAPKVIVEDGFDPLSTK